MKKILTYSFLLLFTTVCCSVSAQFAYNYLKAADEYFKKGDYNSAAQYYEKALAGSGKQKTEKVNPYVIEAVAKEKIAGVSNRESIIYKTAESYRMLNNFPKAEPFYAQAAEFNKFPHARFWYATSLRYNSKFDLAEAEFAKFLSTYQDKDEFTDKAAREIENLKFIQKELQKDITRFHVTKISADGITHGADYAPAVIGKTMVAFTSTRPDSALKGKNIYINSLYQGTTADTKSATKLNIPQPEDMHQGVGSFSADGSQVYFTRWSDNTGKKTASIFFSKKQADGWSQPLNLGAGINEEGFSSQEPFITSDGKMLFFASNRPGGQGKMDLWAATIGPDGMPTTARNLGTRVNTKEDERAPYYYAPAGSLIFSSNGRTGMGGFDFYQSKGGELTWSDPLNLGYPVNSVKDDIYLVSTAEKYFTDHILFSSDRLSACCLEMFSLHKTRLKKNISGSVVDCDSRTPIAGARIVATDATTKAVVFTKTTDERGQYEISLDEYQPLTLAAEAEGYTGKSLIVNVPQDDAADTLSNPALCLTRPLVAKPYEENKAVVLNNVYYDFNKAVLKPGSYKMLDSLAALFSRYPNMVIEISGHTDDRGNDELNMRLSELRARACVDYLISRKGINPSQLQAKGYGETQPIASNKKANGKDDPEGRQKNRRTEFKVLHY